MRRQELNDEIGEMSLEEDKEKVVTRSCPSVKYYELHVLRIAHKYKNIFGHGEAKEREEGGGRGRA